MIVLDKNSFGNSLWRDRNIHGMNFSVVLLWNLQLHGTWKNYSLEVPHLNHIDVKKRKVSSN